MLHKMAQVSVSYSAIGCKCKDTHMVLTLKPASVTHLRTSRVMENVRPQNKTAIALVDGSTKPSHTTEDTTCIIMLHVQRLSVQVWH